MSEEIEIITADLFDPSQAAAVMELVSSYAQETIGGEGLSADVREFMIPGLRAHPTHLVFLARRESEYVGAAVCFVGYSTFAAAPLVNVHDMMVLSSARRMGVGRALLQAVEQHAKEHGCCKITLEVRADNTPAQGLYQSLGFLSSDSANASAAMWFWHKKL
jgi:ribosomal protein S18 acetylase RimI-like enzyme